MPRIFISYRRDDAAYVAAILSERLRMTFGAEAVFIDIDTIPFGIDFRDHIKNAVARCDVLLAIIGDTWLAAGTDTSQRRLDDPADFVRIEIEAAISRNIPVVPVLTGKARMPSPSELPKALEPLAFRNAAELRAGRDMNHHLDLLIRGLQQHLTPDRIPPNPGETTLDVPAETPSATLEFMRDTGWFGKLVAFQIHVDDHPIGTLQPGETLKYPVGPGKHRLSVTGGGTLYGASKEISIAADQTLSWKVGWNATGGVKLSDG